VAAPLHQTALIQIKNLFISRHCGQPLGDYQHRVGALTALDRLLHQPLALGIRGTGVIIANQQL
jgi:hypothetical protein